MTASRQRSLYHGWVVLAFFLLCGAIAVLSIPLIVADLDDSCLKYVLVGAGSLLGGFLAGLACPYPRMNEVGTAAVAVVLFMVALLIYTPMGDITFRHDAAFALGAIVHGSIALLCSLAGALLANRMRWREPGGWRVMLMSTLFAFGSGCVLILLVTAVFAAEMDDPSGVVVFMLLVAFAVSAFVTGVFTQAAVPYRVGAAAGFGPFAMTATFAVVGMVTNDDSNTLIQTLIGIAILGAIMYGLSRWGSSVAHRFKKSPEDHIPPAVIS